MKKLFLTFVLFLLSNFYLKAQQATTLTPGIIAGTVCRGSAVLLPFTTNGVFEDGNVFKVQIKQILATTTWIDATTEATDNILKFVVPENLTGPSANGSYAVRIVASKPNITSPEMFLPFLSTKPVVNLVGATSLNTNPYSQADLQFVGSGVFPIRVVFEDSTEIKVFNINPANPTNFTINPGETKTYKVAYADNVCGRGQGSGSAKIEVNEIALKAQLFSNEVVCLEGILKIQYAASDKFNANNIFKIGLRELNGNRKEYELDAVEKDGFIEAKIPNTIPISSSFNAFNVRIVSSSPKAISPWHPLYNVIIGQKAFAEFSTAANLDVTWGKEISARVNIKGASPYNLTFSDGSSITNGFPTNVTYPDIPSFIDLKFKPDRNQTYSITSFSSGCGKGEIGNNKISVTVSLKPGALIDSLKEDLEICLGGSFSAKYSTKAEFGDANQLVAYINSGLSQSSAIKVPATFNNGIMKVTIPNDLNANNPTNSSYYLGISYSNGEINYSNNRFLVKSLPKASLYNTSDINIDTRKIVSIPVSILGSIPVSILLDDSTNVIPIFGSTSSNGLFYAQLEVPVTKSKTFKIKSVSNMCGLVNISESNSVKVNLQRLASNDISIYNYPDTVCTEQKAKIYFNTQGGFTTSNIFKVELMLFDNVRAVIGTGKNSPIEVTFPDVEAFNGYGYSLRVSSDNPLVISDKRTIAINKKPEVSFFMNLPITDNVLPDEKITFSLNRRVGLASTNTFNFSDGTSTKSESSILRSFDKSTNFMLLSVSNKCGVGSVLDGTKKVTVAPIRIRPLYGSTGVFSEIVPCIGSTIIYPYSVEGKVGNDLTFTLQIASTKDSIFKDIVANTTDNPIRVKISTDFKDGNYLLRLMSNTPVKQYTRLSSVYVQIPASVSITSADGKNALAMDATQRTQLKYDVVGGVNATVFTTDNAGNNFRNILSNNRTFEYNIEPRRTTVYAIKSVENSCGFGKITGESVKITVSPVVIGGLPSVLCMNKDVFLNYATFGDFEAGNVFKFTMINRSTKDSSGAFLNTKYSLGEVITNKTGSIKVKIPDNAALGNYELEVTSSKPETVKYNTSQFYTMSTIPDITIGGNTTIIAGEKAFFAVSNNNFLKFKNYPDYSENFGFSLTNISNSFLPPPNLYRTIGELNPSQTTTYTVKSVQNACGYGKSTGNVTITVLPNTSKNITIDASRTRFPSSLCTGIAYDIYFSVKGTYSASNKFTVQISDKNGENFKDIPSEGTQSPLKVIVPTDLSEGDYYRIRVVGSDNDSYSSANNAPLIVSATPTASLDSTSYLFAGGKPVKIKINLTGKPAWALKFGIDEQTAPNYSNIKTSPFAINLNPKETATYKIFSVNDAFCIGKVIGTNTVKLELITANEELSDFEVKLFPNPTSDRITVQSDNFKNATLQIFDNLGRQILQQNIIKSETILDTSNFNTGQYLLQIERENKRSVYKIHKL